MKKILFLDFDGVLFDTVEEAYNVCINTQEYRNITLPKNAFELFRKYRPIVGPAWNYYFIMDAIVENYLPKQKTFSLIDKAKSFEESFFYTRKKLKEKDYNKWLQYNRKYPFTCELEKINNKIKIDIYIVTTKDKQTVLDLLTEHGILFVKDDYVFGSETFKNYGSKKKIIQNILSKTKKAKAIFIDDLYEHLILCEDIENLILLQVDWGYIDKGKVSPYISSIENAIAKITEL